MKLAAWAAAVAAFGYAIVSCYWAAGGTAMLTTVGGPAERLARSGGTAALAVIVVTVLLKVLGGLLALSMIMGWGRRLPPRGIFLVAVVASVLLILYGAVQLIGESLAETGVIRPSASADWTALRWHLGLWDLWFLLWFLLLGITTWHYRAIRLRTAPGLPVERAGQS